MDPMRQERLINCMNAAVNLYGVVSFAELIRLYNRYAADELAPVSNLLTEPEIDAILALPPPDDFDLEDQERWFKAVELDGPLDLSPADEARFAEDTIRRIYALGRFGFPFRSILRD